MPFPAARVGLDLEPNEREVAVRDILAYAAGLGAADPAFLDDAQAGGLRALPFQCVSLEWPVVLSLRAALEDRLSPEEARRGVHAAQDSLFHRPIVPGDRLVTRGQLVAARASRSGVECVCRLETTDQVSGEPVTTSWTRSVYRDVALEGEASVIAAVPDLHPAAGLALTDDAVSLSFDVPREMPHVYSECADIWNPIHTERTVALAAGLPDIILHGTATWALAGLAVLRAYAGSDVGRLKRLSGRFTGMIIPGETITIRHARAAEGVAQFEVLTGSGAPAISQGVACF